MRSAGCYGIAIAGFDAPELVGVPCDAPTLQVAFVDVAGTAHLSPTTPIWIGTDSAEFAIAEGRMVLSRSPSSLVLPAVLECQPRALPHPYLALPAAVVHHWRRAVSLHAGAIVVDDVAWAIVADKGGGKSSMVAAAGLTGLAVVCDDLLVIDSGHALAGPRCVDLRSEVAPLFPTENIGMAGSRGTGTDPPAADYRTKLGGFIFLDWADEGPRIEPLGGSERLARLMAAVGLGIHPLQPDALLGLAQLPAFEFVRPRDTSRLLADTDALITQLSGTLRAE